jgi:AbrB family looped-hinge helix DNA binding protein
MESVTISPKFQVVIPQKVRRQMALTPGQKMHVIAYDDKVVFIPMRPIREARGALKGMNTDIQREEEDRL